MNDAQDRLDREDAERAHVVAQRAIWRLDLIEWVLLAGGASVAMVGGAGVAWMLGGVGGMSFRSTWMGASVVLFVVPGVIVIFKNRKEERAEALRKDGRKELDDG